MYIDRWIISKGEKYQFFERLRDACVYSKNIFTILVSQYISKRNNSAD